MDTSVGNFNCPASCKNFNGENTEKRGVINKAATGLRGANLCNLYLIYYLVPIYDNFLYNY
jgi:hypothetical protein